MIIWHGLLLLYLLGATFEIVGARRAYKVASTSVSKFVLFWHVFKERWINSCLSCHSHFVNHQCTYISSHWSVIFLLLLTELVVWKLLGTSVGQWNVVILICGYLIGLIGILCSAIEIGSLFSLRLLAVREISPWVFMVV